MSLRPELPYTGPPIQRVIQRLNDLQRVVDRIKTNNPGVVTRGSVTATFTASNIAAAIAPIASASTTGHTYAVATSGLAAGNPTVCQVTDNNNGTVTISCYTLTGAAITASTTIFYEVWPA